MVFSSIPFIYFFFPIYLIVYYISINKYKNIVLLAFSLLFYAWGEPVYILLMLLSALVDYVNALKMEKCHNNKEKKKYLIISVLINLGVLTFFKYIDFLISIFNFIFNINMPYFNLALPIGISFYTFQTMSYIIDVYKGKVKTEHSYIDFMAYVSMFPQLISGPILRYNDISKELKNRSLTLSKFSEGLLRFMRGLFKKVLIANNIGYLFTIISGMTNSEISVLAAWLGIISFAFQIYFDFSGYSDMAIGMGKMLGFTYLENFNYPYISKSITEFWRRWHISLSEWFKDYVYIPLGGAKVSRIINIRNIIIVWTITGLWHGASYNFILWGLYYGVILVLEKFIFNKYLEKLPNTLRHIYTIMLVLIGWLIFVFNDMGKLSNFAKIMFGFGHADFINSDFIYYFRNYFLIILISVFFSLPIYPKARSYLNKIRFQKTLMLITLTIYIILFIITISYIINETYNPFLYFRF
jgi:alginate O-acetyltransferase complex protein AlgI